MDKILSQFARIESHGLVASKSRPPNPPPDWKAKTTVDGVCGEGMHLDTHAKHVENPTDVDIIFGMNPMDLAAQIKTRFKEIKASGQHIKADAMVMCSGVFSYPKTECDEDYYQWADDCVAYLKEKYGDKLKSVVAHYDESHPHLHFFLADTKTLSVNEIDPFRIARKEEEAKQKSAAAIGEKYVPQMKAQKVKMSEWLDDYFTNVSQKYGQAREVGARKARKFGTTRQVKMELAFDKKTKELEQKIDDLNEKNRRLRELGQTLYDQTVIGKKKAAELDDLTEVAKAKNLLFVELIDHLTQEALKLRKNKNLGAATALEGRITGIRKVALDGGVSEDKLKLN